MGRLVAAVLFKAQLAVEAVNMPVVLTPTGRPSGYFRCEEQLELQTLIAGLDVSDMPAVKQVAEAGQAAAAVNAAARARTEIEAAMWKLQTPS